MKTAIALVALLIFASAASAQTLEDRVKTLEETLKKQEDTIKQQQKLIEEMKAELSGNRSAAPASAGQAGPAAPPADVQQQVRELKEEVDRVAEAQQKVVPSVFNPSIGLVGETVFSYNSKPSSETGSGRPGGWDVFQRSVELNAAGSIDTFAQGYVVLNASADPVTGESTAQVEEAALYTTSLPWNLQLKAGRFFGEFGRLSYIHDHELPFVNRPLALDQYVGGESKTDGAQVNYLLPLPHYVSLTVGAGDQFGDTPNDVGNFRNGSNLNYFGRLSTYFDLTPNISLEPGISGLWNPSTTDRGGQLVQPNGNIFYERERRLADLDLVLAYRPLRNNQFESVTWGTEVLRSDNRYDMFAPDGSTPISLNRSVGALGGYSYLAYRFSREWTVGFLGEWLEDAQNSAARTSAYSPYITWYLSHWNQLRLQYTHTQNDVATGLKPNDAVYLQWAWIIGSHAHGWQQR